MAEVNSQIDRLNQILEVEKEVSELIENAVTETEKKVTDTKLQAHLKLQEQSLQIQSIIEKEYDEKLKKLQENRSEKISDFEKSLQKKNQNINNFNAVLNTMLFK